MKLEFLSQPGKDATISSMLGKSDRELSEIPEKITRKLNAGDFEKATDLISWCIEQANTPQEAVIYAFIGGRMLEDYFSRSKDSFSDLLKSIAGK